MSRPDVPLTRESLEAARKALKMNPGIAFVPAPKTPPGAARQENGGPIVLICPRCRKATRQEVTNSRPHGDTIHRRRDCPCGYRFTTVERIIGKGGGALRQIETWAKTKHVRMAWEDPVL